MRLSRYFLPILKETPKEAEIVSHRLMLRAGMIRQEAAGSYAWLPLGVRVLHKICAIVREEQDRAGAIEVLMPTIQSADLWRESGRYDDYGKEMLRIRDRHDRDMLYGPTNEEMITEIFRALGALVQGSAAQPLSHPVEVPRRGEAALRRDALARIPDEGRLFLRPRSGGRAPFLQQGVHRLSAHVRATRPDRHSDARRIRPDRRRPQPRVRHSGVDRRERGVLSSRLSRRSRPRPRTSISTAPRRCRGSSTSGPRSTPPRPTNTMRPPSRGWIRRTGFPPAGSKSAIFSTSEPSIRLP